MKKKIYLALLATVCALCCALGLIACDPSNNGGNAKPDGTYYQYENGAQGLLSITLDGNRWKMGARSGEFTLNGTEITLLDSGGEFTVYIGKLYNGELTLEMDGSVKTFYKKGYEPSGKPNEKPEDNDPKQYTVTFDANGGAFTDGSKTYSITVDKDAYINQPDCILPNYYVDYWATDKDGESEWYFYTGTVNKNLTLYAVWDLAYNYKSTTSGVTITSFRGRNYLNDSIEIPEKIDGEPVTAINNRAFNAGSYDVKLKRIVLPDSITSIGEGAFVGCKQLEEINIPKGVTTISKQMFSGCTSLKKVDLSGITRIEYEAFYGCNGLEELSLPAGLTSIDNDAFNKASKSLLKIEVDEANENYKSSNNCLLTADGTHLILGCRNSWIPNGVTHINNYAFYGCDMIQALTLSGFGYSNDEGFTNVRIPQSLTNIGQEAFYGCTALEHITVSENLERIGTGAFYFCEELTTIEVDVNNKVFSGKNNCLLSKDGTELVLGVKECTIPSSVTKIGRYAFYGRTSLKSISIPDTVKSIDYCALGYTSISNINIPSGTALDGGVFLGCEKLESISLPDGMKTIQSNLFNGCTSLESITIPDSVIFIGYHAFRTCKKLESVVIPDGVTEIDTETFWGCSALKSITIPTSVTSIGRDAFHGCSALESVTLLGVTSIDREAFRDCTSLKSVTFSDSLTFIGQAAFEDCSALKSITIPASVTTINHSAFSGTSLESAIFENPNGWGSVWTDRTEIDSATLSNPKSAANYLTGYTNNLERRTDDEIEE